MRISTNVVFDQGIQAIQQRQQDVAKLQQQASSGRRVLTPADDPVAASRILDTGQSQAVNRQYGINGDNAKGALNLEEATLSGVTALLQDVKVTAIHAGNATLADTDRAILAATLRGRFQELLGLVNTADSNGQHLFSGYQGTTRPFSESAAGVVTYAGDQGQRLLQISASRQIAVSDSGADVFQSIRNGNGVFVTAATAANSGSGIVSAGTVTDLTKWNAAANPRDFTVRFAVDASVTPSVTTYDIVDNVNNISLLTGAAPAPAGPYPRTYTSGSDIVLRNQGAEPAFDFGVKLSVEGAPANGDTFTVKASSSVSMFDTLNNLITALGNPGVGSAAASAKLANNLNSALQELDSALDKVLTTRASVGTRIKEVEASQSVTEEQALQYEQTRSQLQDLDYARALSDLSLQQMYLEAAQKTFVKVQGLSLFNFV